MFLNLLAQPARQVLNAVYHDIMLGASKADRADIINWCTCTYAEAKAFQEDEVKNAVADRMTLARTIGEVG